MSPLPVQVNPGAVPVRRWHERRLVAQLAGGAARSRAELAEATGLSAPTVGKLVDELLAAGLLEEARTATTRTEGPSIGRPARPVQMARAPRRFVALQLGVRRTRLAALPVAGPVAGPRAESEAGGAARWPVSFDTPRRAATWRRRLGEAAERLGFAEPWGVVVSVPGVVDEAGGRVLLSPNLHWTEGAALPGAVRACWPAPVVLVQEIRALALGQLAAEPGERDFLLVDFGEGVGAALVRDGALYEAALPLSGELGHTPVRGCDRPCGCGAVGCVETLVSRPGLLRSWAEAQGGHPGQAPTWAALGRHVESRGVEPWLREALAAAGRVIAGAMNVAGVKQVVIAGALTELPGVVMDELVGAVERSSMWARLGQIDVRPAPRRRAGGLVAAAVDRLLLPIDGGTGYAAMPGIPASAKAVERKAG